MPGASSADQQNRKQWRCECFTGKRKENKFTKPVGEHGLLSRWPKFLDLQVKLPDPGELAALVEMREMCPGKPATLEEIAAMCEETPYRTPFWKGQTPKTDIPERDLSPAEVEVINNTYLELNAAFLAKRQGQAAGEAIVDAEQNITKQNMKAQAMLAEVRRDINVGFSDLKGMVRKKRHAEEYWYIPAMDGTHYKHEPSYHHELGHLDATERFAKVAVLSKNTDGTWAYRCHTGIGVAPASAFQADPTCEGIQVTVNQGRNRGKTGVIAGEPKAPPGRELGGDTDVFKVLLDGGKQKSSFKRDQLAFQDDHDAPPEADMPSGPVALVKGGKGKARAKGAGAKGAKSQGATSKGRGKRAKQTPIAKACANNTGVADESTSPASPQELAAAQKTSAPGSDEERRKRAPQAGKRRVPDTDSESGARMSVAKKAALDEESVSTDNSDVEARAPPPPVLKTRRSPCLIAGVGAFCAPAIAVA